MLAQLALDRRVVLHRVGAVERRQVEHVHEQPRALDVGEELVAEPGARARALDQPRDVGEHELALVGLDRAEHRLERRERVVGDLRPRARQPRAAASDLPAFGSPTSPTSASSFSRSSSRPPRPPAPARRSAAPAASGSRSACCRARPRPPRATTARWPGSRQVPARSPLRVLGNRPRRHPQLQRLRRRPHAAAPPSPCAAALRLVVAPPRWKLRQIAQRRRRQTSDDVAAPPAVAAVGPAACGTCASRRKRHAAVARRRRPATKILARSWSIPRS